MQLSPEISYNREIMYEGILGIRPANYIIIQEHPNVRNVNKLIVNRIAKVSYRARPKNYHEI